MNMNNLKKTSIIKIISTSSLLLVVLLTISACGKSGAQTGEELKEPAAVSARSIKESSTLKEKLTYSGLVSSVEEAKIIARTSGHAEEINFNVGDEVNMGDTLARIDDVDGSSSSAGFNSNQVRQAQIAVSQALASYRMAETNYENLLVSTQKDLNQAEIAKNQSLTGKGNTASSVEENFKSAELALETAQAAAESAKISLENRRKTASQGEVDAKDNAETTADGAANIAASIISSINNIASLDDQNPVSLNYKSNLGALDPSALSAAKNNFALAKTASQKYSAGGFKSLNEKIDSADDLAEKTKRLADSAKTLFEKTMTSVDLPQTSLTGASLSGLQSQAAGFQSQISAAIAQINGAKQLLANTPLNNTSTLDALEKAYDLAKKQEAQAAQNLNSLKAGNKSQSDAADFGYQSAANQYATLKTKLDSQISVAKSQLDIASFQYQSAGTVLQGLYDIHLAIAPIDGTVTQKLVSAGDAVSAGQLLAVVSRPEDVKIVFYTDQDNLFYFRLGQAAEIKDNDGKSYAGKITAITPQADSLTRRFQIEVRPERTDLPASPAGDKNAKPPLAAETGASGVFVLGTVMDVIIPITKTAKNPDTAILPLSAIEVGQSGNYVFIIENGIAKKTQVEIVKVEGENAEVKIDLPEETLVIVDGNKLLADGDPVVVKSE
jgi:multidrug efflux pump subunit AcrA (membrane-fusion protein)